MINGIICRTIYFSYRKLILAIPDDIRLWTNDVKLHVNERNNRHYIYCGEIVLVEFRTADAFGQPKVKQIIPITEQTIGSESSNSYDSQS
jgi:hypothetical protein